MIDVFGYERNARSSGQVASSEFAVISVGGKQSLVQSVNVSYQQQLEQVGQIGDSNVYWLPGRPMGNLSCSKLVGAGGFLSGWRGSQCGKITPLSITVDGGKCGFTGRGNLQFDGGIIQSFNIALSAQQLQISETVNIQIASLSAS